jgi:hypothetical protein
MSDDKLKTLLEALSKGSYPEGQGSLINGAPLEVEILDLSKVGLYSQDQKDQLIAEGAAEDDFVLANTVIGKWGNGFWARKSDEGVKRHTSYDKDLKLHKLK